MAWTSYQLGLAAMMMITGSINTLAAKWADVSMAVGAFPHIPARVFDHPFLQAVGMFLGEFTCFIMFQFLRYSRRRQGREAELGNLNFNPLVFLPAALCDMCGTSTMYIGLNLTFASSFQMLRGAVIIFTALLSVAFLRNRIRCHMWVGIFVVVLGLVCVGLSDVISQKSNNVYNMITGDLLIIMAQIIVAIQMVYEEKFVKVRNINPLQAVGWEGFWGFTVLGTLLIPFYFIKAGKPFTADPEKRLENSLDGLLQIGQNWQILVATIGNILSIAFFNFSGLSVTQQMSATTRMVLDSARTLVVWAVSMAVGWQVFEWKGFIIQSVGFILLIAGMCLYNDIVILPLLRRGGCISRTSATTSTTTIQDNPDIAANERSPLLKEAAIS